MLEMTPKASENKAEELITLLCKSLVYLNSVYSFVSFMGKGGDLENIQG